MPYVKPLQRLELLSRAPKDAGELNYVLTKALCAYLDARGESYQTHCEIAGVLTGLIQEWTRRKVNPYEDKKCKENGDVF